MTSEGLENDPAAETPASAALRRHRLQRPVSPSLLRGRQGACAPTLAGAGARGHGEWTLLIKAEKRVFFVWIHQPGVAAPEKRKAVLGVQGPVSPIQVLHWNARAVGGSECVAAVDEVDEIGEPLPFRSSSGRIQVAAAVSRPELADPNGGLRIRARAGAPPGVQRVPWPNRVDVAGID